MYPIKAILSRPNYRLLLAAFTLIRTSAYVYMVLVRVLLCNLYSYRSYSALISQILEYNCKNLIKCVRFMKPALPETSDLDQQTGLVIMVYYICAFPGSVLNGYLVQGSTYNMSHTTDIFAVGLQLVNRWSIPDKVDKYKRFKLITCIWYASAVVGFSGRIPIQKFFVKLELLDIA